MDMPRGKPPGILLGIWQEWDSPKMESHENGLEERVRGDIFITSFLFSPVGDEKTRLHPEYAAHALLFLL